MKRIEELKAELEKLTDEAARIEICFGSRRIPEELKERTDQLRKDIKSMERENERVEKIRHLGETILTEAGLEERENGWMLTNVDDSEDEILSVTMDIPDRGCVIRFYCTYANLDECHNWHKKECFIISSDWMLNSDSIIDLLRAINADAPDGMKYFRLAQFNATVDRIKDALKNSDIPERGTVDQKVTVS